MKGYKMTNPITVKRFEKQLADMVYYFMEREDLSLLEAYLKVSHMASSDTVLAKVKSQVSITNSGKVLK